MTERTNLSLEDYRWDAQGCCGCRGCIYVDYVFCEGAKNPFRCPSLIRYNFDVYTALGRGKVALRMLNKQGEYTDSTRDILYKCNLCGACDAGCKRNLDLDPLMVMETFRIWAIDNGHEPPAGLKKVNDTIAASDNRYGAAHDKRADWLPADARISEKPEMLYFVGCNSSYKSNAIALATIGILEEAGVEYALFPDEKCCGHSMYVSGELDATIKQAEKNIAALKASGADTIVTSCAECYKTWKVDYPKIMDKRTDEMGYKVIHITELAAEKIEDETLKPSHEVNMTVTYHDACNMARLADDWVPWHGTRGRFGCTEPVKQYRRCDTGLYKQPRAILKSIPGLKLKETSRKKENALCCGAGGGVGDAYPDFAQDTAKDRLNEISDTGAEAIVAGCPYCGDNLSTAIKDSGKSVKTYDITQILYESLTGKGGL